MSVILSHSIDTHPVNDDYDDESNWISNIMRLRSTLLGGQGLRIAAAATFRRLFFYRPHGGEVLVNEVLSFEEIFAVSRLVAFHRSSA